MHSLSNNSLIKVLVGAVLFVVALVFFYITLTTHKDKVDNPFSTTTQNATSTKELFTIIAFGDSLTAGYGGPLEDSYPVQLEKQLQQKHKNITLLNMGVSGESTSGSLDRVDFVISQKPSLVLLGIGANDMLRSTPPKL